MAWTPLLMNLGNIDLTTWGTLHKIIILFYTMRRDQTAEVTFPILTQLRTAPMISNKHGLFGTTATRILACLIDFQRPVKQPLQYGTVVRVAVLSLTASCLYSSSLCLSDYFQVKGLKCWKKQNTLKTAHQVFIVLFLIENTLFWQFFLSWFKKQSSQVISTLEFLGP